MTGSENRYTELLESRAQVVADDTMTVVSKMDSAVRKVTVKGKRIDESISTFQRFVNKK